MFYGKNYRSLRFDGCFRRFLDSDFWNDDNSRNTVAFKTIFYLLVVITIIFVNSVKIVVHNYIKLERDKFCFCIENETHGSCVLYRVSDINTRIVPNPGNLFAIDT